MKPSPEAPDPAVLEALRLRAGGREAIPFEEFMEVALYHPQGGYYRRDRPRVGYGPGTDFLTATASAPILGRLVTAAAARLLAPAPLAAFHFVEIGAEPGAGILGNGAHPFASARCVRVGEQRQLHGPCVVFSNELFDAQPFRRFRFRAGRWRELGVHVGDKTLAEAELAEPGPTPIALPADAEEGALIDAPFKAAQLAAAIAREPWSGLFLAFDYGKSWEELQHDTPQGTARAYAGHAQSNDLLAAPGHQDLTCHVCWDWIGAALERAGFETPVTESMEAFLVRNAGEAIARIVEAGAASLDRDKLAVLQLLHPANLGQRFQVMSARRTLDSTESRALANPHETGN